MADRPILFSKPMVLALLDGRKTQTRRIFKNIEAIGDGEFHIFDRAGGNFGVLEADVPEVALEYVRYDVGDRLYVREAWRVPAQEDHKAPRDLDRQIIGYEADCSLGQISATGKFRQGMHMPRWASRLTLIVTDVRVQRLQDVTAEDCRAEGHPVEWDRSPDREVHDDAARDWFRDLWDSLNSDRGYGWVANPWVVAISFTVHQKNIDEIEAAHAS